MEKNKSSTLDKETRRAIYKTYKYKLRNTTMTYGLAILLADPVIIYLLFKYIFTKDIVNIPLSYVAVISLIAILVVCLHVYYIRDILIITRKLKIGMYECGVGVLTTKEDIGGQESENIGYSRYQFKIDKKYKCKVLLAEDYNTTNIGDECIVIFMNNKAKFALNSDTSEMQKYIENYETSDNKKKRTKESRKIHIKDIFNRKKGIKGILSGIVGAYDKMLDNGDNIEDEERKIENERENSEE